MSLSPAPPEKAAVETPLRIEDLERRLNTDRTLDIFTMQPRVRSSRARDQKYVTLTKAALTQRCRLQIQPASLPFRRELRFAADAHMSFTPSSDPEQRTVTHPRAHILLLTDLFLVCERITPQDAASTAANGADFWLVYPPLAGKHVRVTHQDLDSVHVTIMQRERLVFRFDGPEAVTRARDLAGAVQAAAEFGAAQGTAPVPPLRQNSLASSSSAYGHALRRLRARKAASMREARSNCSRSNRRSVSTRLDASYRVRVAAVSPDRLAARACTPPAQEDWSSRLQPCRSSTTSPAREATRPSPFPTTGTV